MKNSTNISIIAPLFQNHPLIIFKLPAIPTPRAKTARMQQTMPNLVTTALIYITQSSTVA